MMTINTDLRQKALAAYHATIDQNLTEAKRLCIEHCHNLGLEVHENDLSVGMYIYQDNSYFNPGPLYNLHCILFAIDEFRFRFELNCKLEPLQYSPPLKVWIGEWIEFKSILEFGEKLYLQNMEKGMIDAN